jgi:hypothetical protein
MADPTGFATVNIAELSQHDALEYRRELDWALYNPGIEFDMEGCDEETARKVYVQRLKEVNAYLATFQTPL